MATGRLDQRRVDKLKPRRSAYDIRDRKLRGFGVRVLPWFRKRPLGDITTPDVRRWSASLHETPVTADRSAPVLSVITRQAEVHGYRPEGTNPCVDIKRYRRQGRERFPSVAEVRRLGEVLARWGRGRDRCDGSHAGGVPAAAMAVGADRSPAPSGGEPLVAGDPSCRHPLAKTHRVDRCDGAACDPVRRSLPGLCAVRTSGERPASSAFSTSSKIRSLRASSSAYANEPTNSDRRL